MIECKIESQNFIIVNVYAPTKDKPQEQLIFLKNLQNVLDIYSDNAIIIGGDFSTYLNVSIDKKRRYIRATIRIQSIITRLLP